MNKPIPKQFEEWDGTIYRFTGNFEPDVRPKSRRVAIRNRKTVYLPEYRANDGRVCVRADLPQSRPTTNEADFGNRPAKSADTDKT